MEMAKYQLKICWVKHLQPKHHEQSYFPSTFSCVVHFHLLFSTSQPAQSNITHREIHARQHQTSCCSSHRWNPQRGWNISSTQPPAWEWSIRVRVTQKSKLGVLRKKKNRLSLPITALSPSSFAIDRVRWTYLFLLPTTTISVALLSGSSLTKWQNPVLPISDFISLIVPLPKVLSISSFSQWRALCHFVSHLIWIPPSMCGRWITE